MRVLTCTCCGSDVTCPQFHNGLVYGYTCIKKVAPAQKQTNVRFLPVEVLKIVAAPTLANTIGKPVTMTFKVEGQKVKIARVQESQRTEQNGVIFVSEQVVNSK